MQGALRTADRKLLVYLNRKLVCIAKPARTRNPPRGNDFDARFERVKRELKPDLIIAFSGATVGNKAYDIG